MYVHILGTYVTYTYMIHTCVCIVNVYTQTARRYIEINMATNLSSGVVLSETINQSVYEKREGTGTRYVCVYSMCVYHVHVYTRYSWYLGNTLFEYTCGHLHSCTPVQNRCAQVHLYHTCV